MKRGGLAMTTLGGRRNRTVGMGWYTWANPSCLEWRLVGPATTRDEHTCREVRPMSPHVHLARASRLFLTRKRGRVELEQVRGVRPPNVLEENGEHTREEDASDTRHEELEARAERVQQVDGGRGGDTCRGEAEGGGGDEPVVCQEVGNLNGADGLGVEGGEGGGDGGNGELVCGCAIRFAGGALEPVDLVVGVCDIRQWTPRAPWPLVVFVGPADEVELTRWHIAHEGFQPTRKAGVGDRRRVQITGVVSVVQGALYGGRVDGQCAGSIDEVVWVCAPSEMCQ